MLFETRYFWAVFASKNPDVTRNLKDLLDRTKKRYASSITIYEVSKLTLASERETVAKLRTDATKKEFNVVAMDSEIAEQAADISQRTRIPMADALIMATAKKLNLV